MRFRPAYALVFALALSIVSSAQTPVTCNVTTFQAPSGSTVVNPLRPSSINRYGTIVGVDANSLPFIRYNTGAIRRMSINIPGAYFFDMGKRNASGVTVGKVQVMDANRNVTVHGFANSGSTTRLIDYPNAINTSAAGINMYGTIVGSFFGAPGNGNYVLKNGAFHTLQTPAEFQRDAEVTAISDTGVIIGNYALANSAPDPDQTMHGFVVINGTFHDLA